MQDLTGIELIIGNAINSLFNVGVTYFALVSGYWGIKSSLKKIWDVWSVMVFYSLINAVLNIISGTAGMKTIVFAFLPISRNAHWYVASYVLLLIFLYLFDEMNIQQDRYKRFLVLAGVVFYIIPTIQHRTTLSNSNGKEFIYIFILYFIGRYIGIYYKDKDLRKIARVAFAVAFAGAFGLNTLWSFVMNKGIGASIEFSKDCSIFILVMGISLIALIKEKFYCNKVINYISGCVLGMCFSEHIVRKLLPINILESCFLDNVGKIGYAIIYSIIVFIGALIIEMIRSLIWRALVRMKIK